MGIHSLISDLLNLLIKNGSTAWWNWDVQSTAWAFWYTGQKYVFVLFNLNWLTCSLQTVILITYYIKEDLPICSSARRTLNHSFHFKPIYSITRHLFCCQPHSKLLPRPRAEICQKNLKLFKGVLHGDVQRWKQQHCLWTCSEKTNSRRKPKGAVQRRRTHHGLLLWEETGFISSSLSHGQWLAYMLDQQGK